tara:strand:- start:1442 stop:1750 length:309 start_codon:yes stop_codon:yes gene_type:complete
MEKIELLKIAEEITGIDDLKRNEARLVGAVLELVKQEVNPKFRASMKRDDVQNLINKCVNSFAATLREEIGLMDNEAVKILERVRLMSETTARRERKKNENK